MSEDVRRGVEVTPEAKIKGEVLETPVDINARVLLAEELKKMQAELDEENKRVQADLDDLNRIAFGNVDSPPSKKDKIGAFASLVVATLAAIFIPVIPSLITWIIVFAGMVFLLEYMKES